MSPLSFYKMHGLGNDFLVLDCLKSAFCWSAEEIKKMADRRRGVGFDQLLVVEPPVSQEVDFTYRIFNADGGEVEHCGNGARCFGKFVRDRHYFDFTRPVRAAIAKGTIEIAYCGEENGQDLFEVLIATPDFSPFTAVQESALQQLIQIDDFSKEFGILSLGNPHAVCIVDDVENAPVHAIGQALQNHPLFPARVNVGFMQILHPQHVRLRVFERGVGETEACGTGACAAAIVGIARGVLRSPVRVALPGGALEVTWAGENTPVFLKGAAELVYRGEIGA